MTENEISVCHVFTPKKTFSNKLAYICGYMYIPEV